jgi:hypothetical protein
MVRRWVEQQWQRGRHRGEEGSTLVERERGGVAGHAMAVHRTTPIFLFHKKKTSWKAKREADPRMPPPLRCISLFPYYPVYCVTERASFKHATSPLCVFSPCQLLALFFLFCGGGYCSRHLQSTRSIFLFVSVLSLLGCCDI